MKFAKVVFLIAGIWGLAVLVPLYFLFDRIGRDYPPVITHPEFYFGFLGVALAWQFVFLVIATDPIRYRPVIAVSVLEKWGYVLTLGVLAPLGHVVPSALAISVPDATLGLLFVISFLKTRPVQGRVRV